MRRWSLSETVVEPLGSRAARKGAGALPDQQPTESNPCSDRRKNSLGPLLRLLNDCVSLTVELMRVVDQSVEVVVLPAESICMILCLFPA